jgi:hypothetical protein
MVALPWVLYPAEGEFCDHVIAAVVNHWVVQRYQRRPEVTMTASHPAMRPNIVY